MKKKIIGGLLILLFVLGSVFPSFGSPIGKKNQQACDNCESVRDGIVPTDSNGNPYEKLLGGAVYRGGNARSGLHSGVLDEDDNDFADSLPYGNVFIDTNKISWDIPNGVIVDIQDDRFKWITTGEILSDKEGHTSTNDPLDSGKTLTQGTLSVTSCIAYVGELKSYRENITDRADNSEGYTNKITGGDYLYRITYLDAAVLSDGTRGNVVMTMKEVDIETSINVNASDPNILTDENGNTYQYTKAVIPIQTAKDMYISGGIADSEGNWINKANVVVKTRDEVQQIVNQANANIPDGEKMGSGMVNDKVMRHGIGGAFTFDISVTKSDGNPADGSMAYAVKDLDLPSYQNIWGRGNSDPYMFSEGISILSGAQSYAVVPTYNHKDAASVNTGWVPNGLTGSFDSPIIISGGSDQNANGVRFNAIGEKILRDKNGLWTDSLFTYGNNTDPNPLLRQPTGTISDFMGGNINSARVQYKDLNQNAISSNNVKKQLAGKIRDSGGNIKAWDQITPEDIVNYLGKGSYAVERADDKTYDTGFATIIDPAGSTFRWTASTYQSGGAITNLFDTTLFTYVEQSHGTGGGVYIESYALEDDCDPVMKEGTITMPVDRPITATVVPEDGYSVKSITIGKSADEASTWTKVDVSALKPGNTMTKEINGKTYTFEMNSDGTMDVTSPSVDDPIHIHADFGTDYHFTKVWKYGEPQDLTMTATSGSETKTFVISKEDAEDTSEPHITQTKQGDQTVWQIIYPSEGYTTTSGKNWPALPIEEESDHSSMHVARKNWFIKETVPAKTKATYSNASAEAAGVVSNDYYKNAEWYKESTEKHDTDQADITKVTDKVYMSPFTGGSITNEPYLKVTYKWKGDHPNKTVPTGKDDILTNDSYDVDKTYKVGDIVVEPKDGIEGFWTFKGWDKDGTLSITEDTLIEGTWEFTPYVNVSYEWDGPHPDKVVPEGESNIPKGDTHIVDTTYKVGDTVVEPKDGVEGYWTFEGWDKEGEPVINEDTVIKGKWNFTPYLKVSYEWEGPHPSKTVPAGKDDIEPGNSYNVDTTYKTGDKVVEPKDGVPGVWTFNGWDKNGTLTINEDTVIKGTWDFAPYVNVIYEWDGPHPDKIVPEGESDIPKGDTHTVDTTYKIGDKVVEPKDGVEGFWTFEGWDREGKPVINEDTVIKGKWNFTPFVNVTYEWEGPHPDVTVPDGQPNMTPGDTHSVDITYKTGDTLKGEKDDQKGTWKFNGWDRTGDITINEDTVIKGVWEFIPEFDIVTEVVNGTITETERDIPGGENRVISYQPNDGYQIVSVTVDGKDVNSKEHPNSYMFSNIDADHSVKVVYEKVPALTIEKLADKEIYNAGDTVTYTITVKQTVEGAEARDVVITDTIPEALTLDKGSIKGDVTVTKEEDNLYELSIASLSGELTYTYTATLAEDADVDEIVNVAQAAASNVPDPAEDDAIVTSRTPKPTIEKTVSNETPIEGETVTYWIKVTEPQDGVVLRNAKISDPLPEGIEPIDGTITYTGDEGEATINGRVLEVSIPELGGEVVISFDAKVTATSGEVDNIATLSGDKIKDISDNALLKVKEPTPVLTKSVSNENPSVGEIVTYTIEASSDITLKNAVITDTAPSGIEVLVDTVKFEGDQGEVSAKSWRAADGDSASTGIFTFEKLDSTTITYQAKVLEAGEHVNTAALTADNSPKGPLEAEAKVVVVEPKAIIEKSVSDSEVSVGDVVSYKVSAKAEKGIVLDAVIEDILPDGMELDKESVKVSDENAIVKVEGSTIKVMTDKLTADEIFITYSAKVVKEGTHVNVVTLIGSNLKEPLSAKASVEATKPVEEVTPTDKPAEKVTSSDKPTEKSTSTDAEKSESKSDSTSDSKSSPKTGDDTTPLIPIVVVFAVALAGLGLIIYRRRKID